MPSKNFFLNKIIFAFVGIAFLIGLYSIYEYSNVVKTDNAYIEADISIVSAEFNGVVNEVLVEENQEVRKGQDLARINDSFIQSPIDGTIAMHNIRLGNYVHPGLPLVAVVPKKLYIKANIKETKISKFHVGSKVTFVVDAVSGKKFTGRVKSIYPATGSKFALLPTDNATGNFTKIVQRIPVIIEFDNSQDCASELKPGMSSIVSVHK